MEHAKREVAKTNLRTSSRIPFSYEPWEKKMSKTMFILTLPIWLSLISGCGYVSKSEYLEHINTIRIPPIDILDADFMYDSVSQRTFDEVIHEKLTQRFNRKWRDGNDAEFTMTIQDYTLKEHGFGPNGEVELLRMTLQIEYQFIDKVRNNIVDESDNYIQVHDFYIVPNRAEPMESPEQAKTLIVDELVEDLYNQLAEQW